MTDIEKNTFEDKRNILSKTVRATQGYSDSYTLDFDDTFVYFEKYENGSYQTYKSKYSFNGTSASLIGTPNKVVKLTQYKDVVEKSLEEKFIDTLEKYFGGSSKKVEDVEKTTNHLVVIKQFEDEEMIAYEPLYVPPNTADSDKEGMTEEEIIKMVDNAKKAISEGRLQANLFHKVPTNSFEWVDAFVNPWPVCIVGDHEVKKGQPVAVAKYSNKKAWELRKSGVIKGPSIGAKASNKRKAEDE